MAKRQSANVDLSSDFVPPTEETLEELASPQAPPPTFQAVSCRLPLLVGDIPAGTGHLSRRVDTNLSGPEGLFWQKLLYSARSNHLTFGDRGEHVDSSTDLLRCIIRGMMESAQVP